MLKFLHRNKHVVSALAGAFVFWCGVATAQDSVRHIAIADGVGVDMVLVEGGDFVMGSNAANGVRHNFESSRPEHRVVVGSFYVGRTEVTQAQWRVVMGENPSHFVGDSMPVENITWEEASRFVTLLSQMTGHRFRLPTEAEWEYAARGGRVGRGLPFPGTARGGLDNACWYCVNSGGTTHKVAMMAPNELGLYDMAGNVQEWCSDWMDAYGTEEQDNPKGPRMGDSRVMRGGHYNSTSSACTVYDRGWYVPTGKMEYFGMRLVMEIEYDED